MLSVQLLPPLTYALQRLAPVGNLWSLEPAVAKLKRMLGFHEFAEFVAGDVGTVDRYRSRPAAIRRHVMPNTATYLILAA